MQCADLDWLACPNFVSSYGDWIHQTVTLEGGNLTTYANGEVVESADVGHEYRIDAEGATVYLGALLYVGGPIDKLARNNVNARFNGELDDMMFFSRALGASEVRALSQAPFDLSGGVPSDLVLYYRFDQDPSDPGGLMSGSSCAASGSYVSKNLGVAGSDYDLLMGQLNDDFGFGKTYVDKADVSGTEYAFLAPGAQASTVPWPVLTDASLGFKWSLRADVPLVYEYAGVPLRIPLPPASKRVGLVMGSAPAQGAVALSAGGVALGATADLSARSEVVFEVANGTALSAPVLFTLRIGALEQQVHVWPVRVPSLFSRQKLMHTGTFEGQQVQINLGYEFYSGVGEEADVVLKSLPTGGELRPLRLNWTLAEMLQLPIAQRAATFTEQPAVSIASTVLLARDGLAVMYYPRAGFTGDDSFTLSFRSLSTGLESPVLTVLVKVDTYDKLPAAAPPAAALAAAEDDGVGLRVPLNASDAERTFGIARIITRLPRRGDLFVASPSGERRKVVAPYNSLDLGQSVRQYASSVEGFSTFQEGTEPFRSNPLAALGSPSCNDKGRTFNDNCVNHRFTDAGGNWTGWMPPVGDAVLFDRNFRSGGGYSNASQAARKAPAVGWVVKGPYMGVDTAGQTTLLLDVRPQPYYAWDGARSQYVRCVIVNSTTYPGSCDEAAFDTARDDAVAEGLSWNDIQMPLGAWTPATPAGSSEPQTGADVAGAFGPGFRYTNYSQAATYAAGFPRYTEFLELGFAEAVFPTGVFIGMPRGGGSVVGIAAYDAAHGVWQQLYADAVLKKKYDATNGNGLYYVFDETVCRTAFQTRKLRIEVDSTGETGIADWNCIDYVQLIGSRDSQAALLVDGAESVTYVPWADEHGEDSFGFVASDCLGNDLRVSDEASVALTVLPHPDAPLVRLPAQEPSFRCGQDRAVLLGLDVLELDGEQLLPLEALATANVTLMFDDSSSNMPMRFAALAADPLKPMAAHWGINVSVSIECAAFPPGLSRANVTLNVTDSAGYSTVVVQSVVVLKTEMSHISSSTKGLGYALFVLGTAVIFSMAGWIVKNRQHPIVRVAQLSFSLLLLLGLWVQNLAILFAVTDDSVSTQAADSACSSMVWLYCVGFMLTFAPLYIKMWRVMRMFDDKFAMRMAKGSRSAKKYAHAAVSTPVLALQVVLMVLVDVAFLAAWMSSDSPLQFARAPVFTDSKYDYVMSSAGKCHSTNLTYVFAIAIYHLLVLAWVTHVVIKSGDIDQNFSESGPLRYALLFSLQILLMSIPIMYITSDKPDTVVFVRISTISLLTLSVCLFVFVPKLLFFYGLLDQKKPKKGSGFISSPSSSVVPASSAVGTAAGTQAMSD
jgi:hypothetical protein